MIKILDLFLVGSLLLTVTQAAVINMPADESTIQAAIRAAVDGDTVQVEPGEYVENINFKGKNIVVGSLFLTTEDTSYISQTIINGNKRSTVVMFENGENNSSVLSGFVITNGLVTTGGNCDSAE
jgi:pectin methylesterase-like acyl-CoA thioesterase